MFLKKRRDLLRKQQIPSLALQSVKNVYAAFIKLRHHQLLLCKEFNLKVFISFYLGQN